MPIPIVFKKKNGKYYYYDKPEIEASDPISIVIGPGAGLFRYTNTMFDVSRDIKEEIPDATKVEAKAVFELPAVNYQTYRQVLSFLRAVYEKHKSEGAILLTLNRKEPLLKQNYRVVVPTQVVGPSTVDYKDIDAIPMEDGEFLAGSIHSHPNFGAFQSGTDHKDEINFDGLHITFGHINRANPEIHTRLCLAGKVYEKPEKPMILTSSGENITIEGYDLILSELTDTFDKAGFKLDKKAISKEILLKAELKELPNAEFPAEWLEKVSARTTVTHVGHNYHSGDWRSHHRNTANDYLASHNPAAATRSARDYLQQAHVSDILRPWEYVTLIFKKFSEVSVPKAARCFVALAAIEPTKSNLQSFHINIMDTEKK